MDKNTEKHTSEEHYMLKKEERFCFYDRPSEAPERKTSSITSSGSCTVSTFKIVNTNKPLEGGVRHPLGPLGGGV